MEYTNNAQKIRMIKDHLMDDPYPLQIELIDYVIQTLEHVDELDALNKQLTHENEELKKKLDDCIYKAWIKEQDEDGVFVDSIYNANVIELAAVLYCLLEDMMDLTGQSSTELLLGCSRALEAIEEVRSKNEDSVSV